MHSSLIGKIEKANRYARETDRITIDRLSLEFRGDNDTHRVTLDADRWQCTCHSSTAGAPASTSWPSRRCLATMLPFEAQTSLLTSTETAAPEAATV